MPNKNEQKGSYIKVALKLHNVEFFIKITKITLKHLKKEVILAFYDLLTFDNISEMTVSCDPLALVVPWWV